MNTNPRFIKGKDGKFQGSIGAGKTAPTLKPAVPELPADNGDGNLTQDEQATVAWFNINSQTTMENVLVAGDPETPSWQLKMLAKVDDDQVRSNVAGNPNTPPETLLWLAANSTEEQLRYSSTEWLDNPDAEGVALNLLQNPNTPSEALHVLYHRTPWSGAPYEFYEGLGRHRNTSQGLLARIADIPFEEQGETIRWTILQNPNCDSFVFHQCVRQLLTPSALDKLLSNPNVTEDQTVVRFLEWMRKPDSNPD